MSKIAILNRSEADADKLYHPQDSDYLKNQVFQILHVFCLEFFVNILKILKILFQFRSGEKTTLLTTNGCIT